MSETENRLPKEVEWVWDARWTSYWFGDKELFEFKKQDFDRKAKDLKKAVKFYKKGCSGNSPLACAYLGKMYQSGRGVPLDKTAAAEYFGKACKAGDRSSCASAGSQKQ